MVFNTSASSPGTRSTARLIVINWCLVNQRSKEEATAASKARSPEAPRPQSSAQEDLPLSTGLLARSQALEYQEEPRQPSSARGADGLGVVDLLPAITPQLTQHSEVRVPRITAGDTQSCAGDGQHTELTCSHPTRTNENPSINMNVLV